MRKNDAQMIAVAVRTAFAMPTSVFVMITILDRTVLRRGARMTAARVESVSMENAAVKLDLVACGVKSEYAQVEMNHVMATDNAKKGMENAYVVTFGLVRHVMYQRASVVEYGICRRKSVNASLDTMVRIAS